jgi:hypothetical protein
VSLVGLDAMHRATEFCMPELEKRKESLIERERQFAGSPALQRGIA